MRPISLWRSEAGNGRELQSNFLPIWRGVHSCWVWSSRFMGVVRLVNKDVFVMGETWRFKLSWSNSLDSDQPKICQYVLDASQNLRAQYKRSVHSAQKNGFQTFHPFQLCTCLSDLANLQNALVFSRRSLSWTGSGPPKFLQLLATNFGRNGTQVTWILC